MEQNNIECAKKYLALQKEYNQELKDSLVAHLKCKELQARCDRYEKALRDISNGKIIAVMIAAKALSGEEEKGKLFTVDEVTGMLVQFALAYHLSTNKDIANDAAEYLNDKIMEDKQC
jgi:hypothetical protein